MMTLDTAEERQLWMLSVVATIQKTGFAEPAVADAAAEAFRRRTQPSTETGAVNYGAQK